MIRQLCLILSGLAISGCASTAPSFKTPDAPAVAVSIFLPYNSSFRYAVPERAQALLDHLAPYEDGWTRSWRKPSERYQVQIELNDGESLRFSVNSDSISVEGGAQRPLSEDELRELDLMALGPDPYVRFGALDFEYASR